MCEQDGLACLAITGPTATGKTELALALAKEFPLEIISMDSAMVYRGMDIGTAKPGPDVREAVPHHLIDILDPEESYSAGRFAADAAGLIASIRSRGRLPLIVGGTLLYLKSLRDGIAPLPARDADVRAAIDARAESAGWKTLHAELERVDPEAAARIAPTDRQRIQRALEVFEVTGRVLSELLAATPAGAVRVETIALMPGDRAALARTIERRFGAMVQQGLVEEVRRLCRRQAPGAPSASMRAVGYRQIRAYLEGRWDWPEAERRAITATRQLAKRQMTWLRHDARTERLDARDPALYRKVRKWLDRHVGPA